MELSFTKYQGTGNDFIIIDNRRDVFPVASGLVRRLCCRRFGVGADGLILLESHRELDYRMVYYNSDGSRSLCGNGARCSFAFARSLGMVGLVARFEASDGVHDIKQEGGLIHFRFFDRAARMDRVGDAWYVHVGSPHYICWVGDVEDVEVVSEGRRIRDLPEFMPCGTNVNFAQFTGRGVKMRTYERGVEDETLSCGTGATAVALCAALLGRQSPVFIEARGGSVQVYFERGDAMFTDIWLAGSVERVFEGTVFV